jgi:outer membrane protein
MKKNKIILTIVFLATFSISTFAQGGGAWNFTYNMGFPIGETNDFISKPSFRGFLIEGRGFVTNNFAVGGSGGWQVFYENFGWVTEDISETATIHGYNRKYINAVPLMATGHFYFFPANLQPYVGLGVGTYYIETRNYMGIYYVEEDAWHFGLAPEVGLSIPFGNNSNAGLTVNVKYNWAVKTQKTSGQSWIGLGLGFSYLF